ncbi:MAG: tetratricopeptide repeat protein [Chloroflexota bacterium]|nr:tetratricopeptide repeat protein [Chloroflexota bacterium]
MTESSMFRNAIAAIRQNQRVRARDILTRLLRADKKKLEYWLWLSSIVDSRKERVYCLQTVLRLDPENQAAKRGLRLLGEATDGEEIIPIPPTRRAWDVDIEDEEDDEAQRGLKKVWTNPKQRLLLLLGTSVVVVGLIMGGIFGVPAYLVGPHLTITPIAWTPTTTHTPTSTPKVRTATPTPSSIQPLWTLLDATYTPMPVYVNTPHPRSEAYSIALRSFASGDYKSTLSFMEQAQRDEPNAPDIQYYIGESHRLLEEYDQALAAYDAAIEVDTDFAPAYLGRALTLLGKSPDAIIEDDLRKVIELAPQYESAYFELALYQLKQGHPETAIETLDEAEDLLLDYSRYYMIRAKALFALGEDEAALDYAEQAYERDITALPIYLILGQAYLENDQPEKALEYIQTYGRYKEVEEPLYWALLGWAYYESGESYDEASHALEKALELDDELALAYQYRGMLAMATGDASQAVNDLYRARSISPDSFEICLDFGLALWANERVNDAYKQINGTEELAHSDKDFGKLYYYRAQVADELAQYDQAEQDWAALLGLPAGTVPAKWLEEAELYLGISTATPMGSVTVTVVSTPSPFPTSE